MQVRITARHFDLEPGLKEHVESKVEHLAHYFDRVDEAHVVFEQEGHRKIADLTVHASRVVVSSEQEADDFRVAFDRAADKVERQIRRHKERVRSRKGRDGTADAAEMIGGVAPEEVGILPEEIASSRMTADEAFKQLAELGARFLVFWNTESDRVNVVYRRDDGDYGLVEPRE
jgi:putative sigma-54 modulation protein